MMQVSGQMLEICQLIMHKFTVFSQYFLIIYLNVVFLFNCFETGEKTILFNPRILLNDTNPTNEYVPRNGDEQTNKVLCKPLICPLNEQAERV